MDFYSLCGVCLLCLCAMIVLRHVAPGMAPLAGAVMGIILGFSGILLLKELYQWLRGFENESFGKYFDLLLKGLGMSLLGGALSNACSDAGEQALARSAQIICSCAVIALCLPLMKELLEKALMML